MNIFKIVLWAVTFILVHMYHWSGIWHPALWCICTSELGEAAASIVWLSVVIQTLNHACKFFGCLTFWYMMRKINSLLCVFEHLVCDVNIDSSYADMTFAQRCLRIYCVLYMTLCCSLNGLQCVEEHSAFICRNKLCSWTAWSWRWRQCDPLKCHAILFQKTQESSFRILSDAICWQKKRVSSLSFLSPAYCLEDVKCGRDMPFS